MEPESGKKKHDYIVKINIGGYKYQTTESTLSHRGPNYFTHLFTKSIPSPVDSKGYYFIDRDGKYFAPILEYLRTGDIVIPHHMSKEAVSREADYFGIQLTTEEDVNLLNITGGIFFHGTGHQNELILFTPDRKGYVIRSATSTIGFSYHVYEKKRLIQVEWDKKDEAIQVGRNTSNKRRVNRDLSIGDHCDKKDIWFLQSTQLSISFRDSYIFIPKSAIIPGCIYTSLKPIAIQENYTYLNGFLFPAELLDYSPDPTEEQIKDFYSNCTPADISENVICCDTRNRWVPCRYIKSKFYDSLPSYLVKYCYDEETVYRDPFACWPERGLETFIIELVVLENLILTRLLKHELVKKDGATVSMKFSPSFHKYEPQSLRRMNNHNIKL